MKVLRIIFAVLFLVLVFFILCFLFRQCPSKKPSVSLLNSEGKKVDRFDVFDTLAIKVEKLKPRTHYDIRLIRSDGREVCRAKLTTDKEGNLPPTPIWYEIGIEYEKGSRVGKFNLKDVLDYKYKIVLGREKEKYEIPLEIVNDTQKAKIFSADSRGNPLNSFKIGQEDVYVVGKNFKPGSRIKIYTSDDRYAWNDGDKLIDVSGGYETIQLSNNETGFKKLIWRKEKIRIGSYDIIADYLPLDGLCSKTNSDPDDGGCNVGFCVQNEAGDEHIEQQVTCQQPVPLPPAAPNPIYKDYFATSESVWVAVNPHTQCKDYTGMNARIYVVNHKTAAEWVQGTQLADVSGGYEETVIQPGCANVNYNLIWPAQLNNGKYDVVVDFEPFGVYDKGTDIVDMLDPVGLLVGDTDMEVTRIKFNWGAGSGAINLRDNVTNSLVPVPEWDKTINRNEPAAYVRNSLITVQAQFHKVLPAVPDTVVVWADTGKGVKLSTQTVNFDLSGYSGYVNFTALGPLPNYINNNNIVWQWYYAVPPYPGSVQNPINVSTHTVCTTFAASLANPAYTKPMLWTSEWAKYRNDEKAICDAIISNLYLSGLKYGVSGWDVDYMLDNGGGMCDGWNDMFSHMAACQGVFVDQICYLLQDDAAPSPEIKWDAIVIKDPGLNQNEPGLGSSVGFEDVDNVYPYPSANDIVNHPNDKRYDFVAGDGHCINFLEYQGVLYLYDPSFGKGPFADTFASVPLSGSDPTGAALHNFRVNYHDTAIDYMRGTIEYNDGIDGNPPTHWPGLCIKTTLIPDLRNPNDPATFEIHYRWW